MRRRELILAGGAAAVWPLTARAQQGAKIPRIGIIDNSAMWDAFRQGLRDSGYVEGRNIVFEYRAAGNVADRLAAVAADLVRLPVDVIAVFGTAPAHAAKQATATIPIVAIAIGDPVRAGLVPSLARPGGNITGNTSLGPDLGPTRLQLIKEVIPTVSRVAFLWNPDNPSNVVFLEEFRAAVPKLGLTLISVEVRNSDGFDAAFATMMQGRPDALCMATDPLFLQHFGKIIEFLSRSRLPGIFQSRENVVAGGFMSYGTSMPDRFRRGAGYVHRILQGTKPADLPFEQPTKFELVISLKTAKALGVTVPPMLLVRADEVIE